MLNQVELAKTYLVKEDFSESSLNYVNSLKLKKSDIEQLARLVIFTNDPKKMYMFAELVKNASIDLLASSVIATKDGKVIFMFARDIVRAPLDKLADALVDIKDLEGICCFTKLIKGISLDKFAKTIIDSGDPKYIYKFSKVAHRKLIPSLARAMLKTKDYDNICMFAKNIKLDNLLQREFSKTIINSNDPALICWYAEKIENASIKDFAEAIIKMNMSEYIFKLATFTKDEEVFKKLVLAMRNTNNAEYIFQMALFISRTRDDVALINELARGIIKTNDIKYMYYFARYVEGAPVGILENVIVECGSNWLGQNKELLRDNCKINNLLNYRFTHSELNVMDFTTEDCTSFLADIKSKGLIATINNMDIINTKEDLLQFFSSSSKYVEILQIYYNYLIGSDFKKEDELELDFECIEYFKNSRKNKKTKIRKKDLI